MNTQPSLVPNNFFSLCCLCLVAALVMACNRPPEPTLNLYRAIHVGDLDQIKRHL